MGVSAGRVWRAALVIGAWVVARALAARLPNPVPVHWNSAGQADGFMAQPWGSYLWPGIVTAVYVLLTILPVISPRQFAIDRFARSYDRIQSATVTLVFAVGGLAHAQAAGLAVPISRLLPLAAGLFALALGRVLPETRPNFFVGIRTPWTMASETVWVETHRVAGKLLIASGGANVLIAVIGAPMPLALGLFLAAVLIPAAYSFVIYRRLDRQSQ